MAGIYTPTNAGWGAKNPPRKAPKPGSGQYMADYGAGSYMPNLGNNYDWDPLPGAAEDPNFWNTSDWGGGVIGIGAGPGGGSVPPPVTGPGRPGSINLPGMDYKGILDRFTGDWRARINASIADMQTRRLGNARGLINQLGVRDPAKMLAQVQQYGLTAADLQAAADNPWSELKSIDQQAKTARGGAIADRAARGGIRSGGSSRAVRMIEDARSRNEALASQQALQALAEQQFQQRDYERNAWDDFQQRSFGLEQQLAAQYQPATAYWDSDRGGYVANGRVYDQNGNVIG